ncbi:type II secretion system minor pseudopilin GspJ [Methylomonas sp. SURF-2]|uniref:Type II secretion system protein J n=1 Tax=Methylomonas subterranea TaxID=2952225 RepID=A0ABT1TDH5_9GAMM|nr:type II secretion system minor pseudopilin GspJ [Methylomonas sp. SURF-2]
MNGGRVRARGFTLLELLIAMAIFAIMAGMAYGGLKAVLDAGRATRGRAEQMQQLRQALYLLNEDLQQAVPRAVRDELGDLEDEFRGGMGRELLTLTRATPELLPNNTASGLLRVSYRFESGVLYRLVWHTLDRTQQSRPLRKRIMEAEALQIRFFGADWSTSWPVAGAGLPRAVEVTLNVPGLGRIRRGFWLR